MLFAYNITFISDYEEEKQEQINLEMDGSINKEERVEIKQTKRRKLQIFKVSSKNINPIKDGLADKLYYKTTITIKLKNYSEKYLN